MERKLGKQIETLDEHHDAINQLANEKKMKEQELEKCLEFLSKNLKDVHGLPEKHYFLERHVHFLTVKLREQDKKLDDQEKKLGDKQEEIKRLENMFRSIPLLTPKKKQRRTKCRVEKLEYGPRYNNRSRKF